jgi:hypothetical protein
MAHDCPYCGAKVIDGPEECGVEDGHEYTEVWLCPSCGKDFVGIYEFEGYFDADDFPIPERSGD